MERHFILDKFNTWSDWRFYLTSKDIPDPEPNYNYVKIDGMDGTLDMSESLTGRITYQDRPLSATFWTDYGTRKEREALLRKITAAIHGKKIKIIEPDDPTHYLYGRVKVKPGVNTLAYAEFSIEATCEPWRYAISESVRRFDVTPTGASLVIHNNGVKTLMPTITVTGSVEVYYNGQKFVLTEGGFKISDIKLYQGVNIIDVRGSGSITFTYREAGL